jgi:type VI secretion system protein ImpM
MSGPGVYGKLPTHGDFIQRNLSPAFVKQWDVWLQHFVAGAKEKIGADWLDIYLTSPLWRFVLSHGVVDEGRWAGILMPSVDQVGRYFPFTIALRLPDNQNPLEFMSMQSSWYSGIEELALSALNGELLLDDLVQALADVPLSLASAYISTGAVVESYAMQIDMATEEPLAAAVYPCMLDALLVKLLSSYSLWSTTGSERVAPCVFDVQGLPAVGKLPAMLDGQWRQWGWVRPCALPA